MLNMDVLIVTAQSRHYWIASELARAGLNAIIVDITDSLGPWKQEDLDGPFGFLRTERLLENQIQNIEQYSELKPIPQGLTIWTQSGPIEMRGPLFAHQFKSHGLEAQLGDYINAQETSRGALESAKLGQSLGHKSYENVWAGTLAHSFSAPIDMSPREAFSWPFALPLRAPYFSVKGQTQSAKQREDHATGLGHIYASVHHITGIENSGRHLHALQCHVTGTDSASKIQKMEANDFIWLLSRKETEFLNAEVANQLFRSRSEEPLWCWQRFRVHPRPHRLLKNMPQTVVLFTDIFQSMTHENFLVLSRQTEGVYDVWVRMAFHKRHDKNHLRALSDLIASQLKNRIAGLEITQVEFPLSFYHEAPDLAPTSFLSYGSDRFKSLKDVSFSNMHFGGSESLLSLDLNGQYERQSEILTSVLTTFIARKEKEEREQLKSRENQEQL